jgi:hypothetical protein
LHFLWWHCDPKPPYEKSMTTRTITFLPCRSVHTTYCHGQTLQMLIKSRMVFCPIINNKKQDSSKNIERIWKTMFSTKNNMLFFHIMNFAKLILQYIIIKGRIYIATPSMNHLYNPTALPVDSPSDNAPCKSNKNDTLINAHVLGASVHTNIQHMLRPNSEIATIE